MEEAGNTLYFPAYTRNSQGQRREFNSLFMIAKGVGLMCWIERRLGTHSDLPRSINYRKGRGGWEKILKQVCLDLINSMPRRVVAVFAPKGGYTKYQSCLLYGFSKMTVQMLLQHYGHGSKARSHMTMGTSYQHDCKMSGFPTPFCSDSQDKI